MRRLGYRVKLLESTSRADLEVGLRYDFFTGKGASAWLMPTVSEQELDKRIAELKMVLFWLEQNAAAIKAGIQALEVQKMTLATLQSMNVGAAELARAFAMPAAVPKPAAAAASAPPPPAATRAVPEAAKPEPAAAVNSAVPDPLQWWNALTQQFQSMAAATAATAASAMTAPMAPPAAKAPAAKAADAKTAQAVDKTAARPAAKTAPRTAAKARAKTAGTAKSAAKAGGKAGKAAAPRKGKPARGASAADLS